MRGSRDAPARATADERGEFDCNLEALQVEGTAFTPAIWLDPPRERRCPDLRLRAMGSIAGRVLTPEGSPLSSVSLHIVRAEADVEPAPTPDSFPAGRLLGSDVEVVETDEQGRFGVSTLIPGRYRVSLAAMALDDALVERYVQTGMRDVRLVADLACIVIRGFDASGGAARGVARGAGPARAQGRRLHHGPSAPIALRPRLGGPQTSQDCKGRRPRPGPPPAAGVPQAAGSTGVVGSNGPFDPGVVNLGIMDRQLRGERGVT